MPTLDPKPNKPNPRPGPHLAKETSATKEFGGLTREQVLGLEPISKAELAAAIEGADADFEVGRYIEVPESYAEFRKVILGKDNV